LIDERALFILAFISSMAVCIVFLVFGPEFFAYFGISKDTGLGLSMAAIFPIVGLITAVYEKSVEKPSFPSFRQVLYPKNAVRPLVWKMLLALYAFFALSILLRYYSNIAALGISFGTIIISFYSFTVELEAFLFISHARS
jgi:hypothetical protein